MDNEAALPGERPDGAGDAGVPGVHAGLPGGGGHLDRPVMEADHPCEDCGKPCPAFFLVCWPCGEKRIVAIPSERPDGAMTPVERLRLVRDNLIALSDPRLSTAIWNIGRVIGQLNWREQETDGPSLL